MRCLLPLAGTLVFNRKESEVAQLRQLTQADLAAFLQARLTTPPLQTA